MAALAAALLVAVIGAVVLLQQGAEPTAVTAPAAVNPPATLAPPAAGGAASASPGVGPGGAPAGGRGAGIARASGRTAASASLRALGPTNATPEEVIAAVRQSVVLIVVERGDGVTSGSGFIAGPEQVVTRASVVDGARRTEVSVGGGAPRPAAVTLSDRANDVALLFCQGALPPALPLGNAAQQREGDPVALTGYPPVSRFAASGDGLAPTTFRGAFRAGQIRLESGVGPDRGVAGGPVYSLRDGSVLGLARADGVPESRVNLGPVVESLRRQAAQ
jgi:hypothetical protein